MRPSFSCGLHHEHWQRARCLKDVEKEMAGCGCQTRLHCDCDEGNDKGAHPIRVLTRWRLIIEGLISKDNGCLLRPQCHRQQGQVHTNIGSMQSRRIFCSSSALPTYPETPGLFRPLCWREEANIFDVLFNLPDKCLIDIAITQFFSELPGELTPARGIEP